MTNIEFIQPVDRIQLPSNAGGFLSRDNQSSQRPPESDAERAARANTESGLPRVDIVNPNTPAVTNALPERAAGPSGAKGVSREETDRQSNPARQQQAEPRDQTIPSPAPGQSPSVRIPDRPEHGARNQQQRATRPDFQQRPHGGNPHENARSRRPAEVHPERPAEVPVPPRPPQEGASDRPQQPQRPGHSLVGRPVTDLDRHINPRLGCALAISHALRDVVPNMPITNNVRELQRNLLRNGYEAVPQNGPLRPDQIQPGDVIIGLRPNQMPGHAAIYQGNGRVFENNSNTGRMTDQGDLNRFNNGMHDKAGRFQVNGFEQVIVLRRRS